MSVILASSSPRRKEIISKLNIDFEIIHPEINEDNYKYDKKTPPKNYAEFLSKVKALSVFENHKNKIVIGADTIVVLKENIVLGKPKNKDDAYNTLMMLSGKIHNVITGVTIINVHNQYTFSESTSVKFFHLNKDDIMNYIKTSSPYDKAGSYGIQDYSSIFVEKIDGCYNNVIGFPIARFNHICKNILNIVI